MNQRQKKVEFGDFQTPLALAEDVCRRLISLGIVPDMVLEPTCGVGAFVRAARGVFPQATIHGYEINPDYLSSLRSVVASGQHANIHLHQADFFATDWPHIVKSSSARLLILGNFPWVTSSVLGAMESGNIPEKSNFLQHKGFDAITGKANFDISEWMLLALIRALVGHRYDVAMLLKTSTARKIIAYVENQGIGTDLAAIMNIDARKEFGAAVDASLLVLRFTGGHSVKSLEYQVFSSLEDDTPARVGHRSGIMVCNLEAFDGNAHMIGTAPQKWRSGVKHDASSVMEFTQTDRGLINGNGLPVDIEPMFLYPLMKGSDIGSNREWRGKYVLVTQSRTGEDTSHIKVDAPKTWKYLEDHASILDARGSSIYAKGHRFSIFGIGDYAFRPWRIAICGLYKKLNFRLISPIDDRPVMFDDTVYYVSFDTEMDAREALTDITAPDSTDILKSMIFWDEKRPIKSSILNNLDWTRTNRTKPIDRSDSDLSLEKNSAL